MPDFLEFQDVRAAGMFPSQLSLKHRDAKVVLLDNYMRRAMCMINGADLGVGNVAIVDASQALRVASHGTQFDYYTVQAGTAPAAYDGTEQINDGNIYHRWDILIESEEAEIRFYDAAGNAGGDIPLLVGFHSYLFTSPRIQIQKRNTTAGTYTITAYRGHTN